MEDCEILCLETGTTDDVIDVLKKFIDKVSLKCRLVPEGFIFVTVSGYILRTVVRVILLVPLPAYSITGYRLFSTCKFIVCDEFL